MSEVYEAVWAFVDNGVVTNIAVIQDLQIVQEHRAQHDYVLQINDVQPGPGKDWLYDEENGFRPPKPFESWSWVGQRWEPPTAKPEPTDENDPEYYEWDEESLSWVIAEWWIDARQQQKESETER